VQIPGSAETAAKQPPQFHASGIQQETAPSGYSAGATEEESRQVANLVTALQLYSLHARIPPLGRGDCRREQAWLSAVLADPRGYGANDALGMFYLESGNDALASRYLHAALQVKPQDPDTLDYAAIADIGLGKYADAGTGAEALRALHRESVADGLSGAIDGLTGDYAQAAREDAQAEALDPTEVNLFASGLATLTTGEIRQTDTLFVAGTITYPRSADLWLGRGLVEVLSQQKSQAIQSLLKAGELAPENLLVFTLLASETDGGGGTSAQVLQSIKRLVERRPESALAHYDLALVSIAMARDSGVDAGRQADAERELEAAVRLDPELAAAHYQLGMLFDDAGDEARAVGELRSANQLQPDQAPWHYRLFRVDQRAGRRVEAAAELKQFEALEAEAHPGQDAASALLAGVPIASLTASPNPCAP
jgi:tetratricopeptide (TPR) repeat protein